MTALPLTLQVDAETAQAYEALSKEDRKKLQLLLSLRLKDLLAAWNVPLRTVMDELGEKAKTRGLTPELLESMLDDE